MIFGMRNLGGRSALVLLITIGILQGNANAFQVEVSDAPTSNLALTLKAIKSAKQKLSLNIYEMTSPEIANALVERIAAGVQVDILEEGQPVGGYPVGAVRVRAQIVKQMKESGTSNHFYVMTANSRSDRRFHFNHAKYAVIDDRALLIGSENYSSTGNPQAGKRGNRGWEVLIHEPDLAHEYGLMFLDDSDPSNKDVVDWVHYADELAILSEPLPTETPAWTALRGGRAGLNASNATKIVSPETSLTGIEHLLKEAESTIDLELMNFSPGWGRDNPRSVLIDAVLAAARRGIKIRILLNDERAFSKPKFHFEELASNNAPNKKTANNRTAELLNTVAKKEKLDLTVKIADLRAMNVTYIHNKGAVLDGRKTFISSINWNENAVVHNREAAVVLESPTISAYYENLFEKDWTAGEHSFESQLSENERFFLSLGREPNFWSPLIELEINPFSTFD